MGGCSDSAWSIYHNPKGWDANPSLILVIVVLRDELFPYIFCNSAESVTPMINLNFLGMIWIASSQESLILECNLTLRPLVAELRLEQQSILIRITNDLFAFITLRLNGLVSHMELLINISYSILTSFAMNCEPADSSFTSSLGFSGLALPRVILVLITLTNKL